MGHTKTNLPSTTDSSPVMSAQVHVEPTYNNRHGRISSHGYEEEGCVLQLAMIMHRDEDSETGNSDQDGENSEKEAMLEAIREIRDRHSETESGGPRRHAVKLGLDRRIAIALNNGGGKVGIAVGRDDEAEIHHTTNEDLGILEYISNVSQFDGAFTGGSALVDLEAGFHIGSLRLRQPLDFFGEVW